MKPKNLTGRDLRAMSRNLVNNRDPLARARLTEAFLFAERMHKGSASYADSPLARAESYLKNGVGKPCHAQG
jgi:hypothetical protein